MISGLLTLILIAAAPVAEAPGDLDALVTAIAPGDGDARLHFSEQRDSPLLREPLVVTGELWRDRQGRLVRQTDSPREETHTLGAGMIVIDQPGRSPRNYSLDHVPELEVLYHGLTALLAGDTEALRRHFEHRLTSDEEGWRLVLQPRDERLSAEVETLALSGRGDVLERFELSLDSGETITTELSRQP
ncbi:MAG: hypothetical protein GVY32_10985 [Gammaproteobacteria bacterium]|jgi:hypothetical protein|nr:hypothetical protein [Gammaproteobacteria bacterium]